ncbi:methyltransferase domain-containing protein [bacterium]|nr:MAG: methyltransferase domain-containing protein [bacterium]
MGKANMSKEATNAAVRNQFGAVAAAYATSAVHASGPDLAAMIDAAGVKGGERVLDMACGAGHTALAFAARGTETVAVDLTPEMLEVAAGLARERGMANITFQQADASALPFAGAEFDLVVTRYAAHHFAEPAVALREAARVLRPGGRFLLVDTVSPEDAALDTFLNAVELLRDDSHVRDWRASEWVRMLKGAGFEADVRERLAVSLDGLSWVARAQTPTSRVAMLKEILAGASPARRAVFEIRDEPWGFSIPVALVAGRLVD